MALPQIERIRNKLEQLRELDPMSEILFGSNFSQYKVNPILTAAQLEQFESSHQISLPEGFREFTLHVGNGGVGPYYGIYPIETNAEEGKRERATVIPFGSTPQYSARDRIRANQDLGPATPKFYEGMTEKALDICTPGCGYQVMLVLDGPKRGQMWNCDPELMSESQTGFWPEILVNVDDQIRFHQPDDATSVDPGLVADLNPFGDLDAPDFFETLPDDGPLFLDWYEHWLDAGLRCFSLEF